MLIGYTSGVFDLFHIGHLNIIKKAKENCDYLIVGVTTDEEVERIKNVKPIIPFHDRKKIIEALKYVDKVVPEDNVDKLFAWEKYKFDIIFKGDDWKGTKLWKDYQKKFSKLNVSVVFFPYTQRVSTTILKQTLGLEI